MQNIEYRIQNKAAGKLMYIKLQMYQFFKKALGPFGPKWYLLRSLQFQGTKKSWFSGLTPSNGPRNGFALTKIITVPHPEIRFRSHVRAMQIHSAARLTIVVPTNLRTVPCLTQYSTSREPASSIQKNQRSMKWTITSICHGIPYCSVKSSANEAVKLNYEGLFIELKEAGSCIAYSVWSWSGQDAAWLSLHHKNRNFNCDVFWPPESESMSAISEWILRRIRNFPFMSKLCTYSP